MQDEVEHAIRPEMLAAVAERLTTTLEESLRIVSQSSREFDFAVKLEVAEFERGPLASLAGCLP